jgi:hypothetical protein
LFDEVEMARYGGESAASFGNRLGTPMIHTTLDSVTPPSSA